MSEAIRRTTDFPSDGRPPKRPRPTFDTARGESTPPPIPLPELLPEVWALVADFLPYVSVLRLAAVSRFMLEETMPRVTALHLHSPAQLHAGLARRYRDVKDVHVYSLIRYLSVSTHNQDDECECVLDEDTAARAVPFLCHFPRLERAFLGGQRPGHGRVEGFIPDRHDTDDDRDTMTTLIAAFSGAFRAGALARDLRVLGLRCPRSHRHTNSFVESSCLVCRNACQNFPLAVVAAFEHEGSSQRYLDQADFDSEQIYNLDVCLTRETIEAILKRRAGGPAMLSSEARLLDLLAEGTRYVIVPDEGKVCYVLKYDTLDLDEIHGFIKNAGREFIKKLSPEAVASAIKRSFAEDERDALPPSDQCYLAKSSFYELREMGLPLDESDFLNADEWDGQVRNEADPYTYDWRFH